MPPTTATSAIHPHSEGGLIGEDPINASGIVEIETNTPIHRLRIEPDNDLDFAIDDVLIPYLRRVD